MACTRASVLIHASYTTEPNTNKYTRQQEDWPYLEEDKFSVGESEKGLQSHGSTVDPETGTVDPETGWPD